jgi:hypothetical protein
VPVITSYLYQNIFTVEVLDDDPTIKTRNHVVYQRPIDIYRGADNPIVIFFKNQDQKPANIAGATFQGFITDYIDGNVVANVDVTISNVTTARGNCTLSSTFIDGLPQNKYKLVFLKTSGNLSVPVYSDDNYSIHAELNIHNGYSL